MVTAPQRYQLSVEQYDEMVEAGIIPEDARVELLEGELIEMSPQGLGHSGCLRRLTGLVHVAGAEPGTVLVQIPVPTSWNSKPEPDLVLLRSPAEQYDRREWGVGDVLLLIEVALSSLDYDRYWKVPHYARAGIREVWLVDVEAELVRIYRQPANGAYQSETSAARGERINAELFSGLNVRVDQILGPSRFG